MQESLKLFQSRVKIQSGFEHRTSVTYGAILDATDCRSTDIEVTERLIGGRLRYDVAGHRGDLTLSQSAIIIVSLRSRLFVKRARAFSAIFLRSWRY
ncbi:hypothetical protein Nham_2058 [Nitrobacter hamburgensis X14]|uniref:Uncharacterized protein n=1 Tax=Nitrobacter hamburgensis (strain DSM 10229 / NCIMB 13809 / X14) TaxID=323097 RepID=Q1QLP1_NITHX|nr:hypothetical protein Nham_2058 [Nitrobacter hamburgensis X14]